MNIWGYIGVLSYTEMNGVIILFDKGVPVHYASLDMVCVFICLYHCGWFGYIDVDVPGATISVHDVYKFLEFRRNDCNKSKVVSKRGIAYIGRHDTRSYIAEF